MKPIAQTRCSIVRECGNNKCLFRMILAGYTLNPTTESDRYKNTSIERSAGPGYYPNMKSLGKGDFLDILCPDFVERRS